MWLNLRNKTIAYTKLNAPSNLLSVLSASDTFIFYEHFPIIQKGGQLIFLLNCNPKFWTWNTTVKATL